MCISPNIIIVNKGSGITGLIKLQQMEWNPMDMVICEMRHLCYKNWECGCTRNPAIWLMTNNSHKDAELYPYEHEVPKTQRRRRRLLK